MAAASGPRLQSGFAASIAPCSCRSSRALDSGRLCLAAPSSRDRDRHLPLRRADSAGLPRGEIEASSTRRSTRWSRRGDPWLGLIEGFFGRPWSWARAAIAIRSLAPHGIAPIFTRPSRRLPAPPLAGTASEAELAELTRARLVAAPRACASSSASARSSSTSSRAGWQDRLAAKPLPGPRQARRSRHIVRRHARPTSRSRRAPGAIVHFAAERGLATASSAVRLIIRTTRSSTPRSAPARLSISSSWAACSNPAVRIFWTGEEVCAREFTPGHLARVAGQLRASQCCGIIIRHDGARMARHLHLRAFTAAPRDRGPA